MGWCDGGLIVGRLFCFLGAGVNCKFCMGRLFGGILGESVRLWFCGGCGWWGVVVGDGVVWWVAWGF